MIPIGLFDEKGEKIYMTEGLTGYPTFFAVSVSGRMISLSANERMRRKMVDSHWAF